MALGVKSKVLQAPACYNFSPSSHPDCGKGISSFLFPTGLMHGICCMDWFSLG